MSQKQSASLLRFFIANHLSRSLINISKESLADKTSIMSVYYKYDCPTYNNIATLLTSNIFRIAFD